ncbi:gluconokinase [Microbacterium sp. MPKO10]|uniref:gluconokinase n=1 Tax=Microbacterium sp. MPKO10 TaxID=2989818 RepID=UPI0022358A58|nr:gluconokinase [Microbacterium sp. MPKO10]MCW4457916.1 gluconokinase [Microbacterium sp. MPKO10]
MTSTTSPRHTPQIVVMGVSGSGKSTVGAQLAEVLDVPFIDGDGLHPESNIEKMAAGTPLTDTDRWPWLAEVGRVLRDSGESGEGAVVACSALRRAYRDAILDAAPDALFVHLTGDHDVLARRMSGRSDHFMPTTLLDSQIDTLEPLDSDEPGITIDIDQSVDGVVEAARAQIAREIAHR